MSASFAAATYGSPSLAERRQRAGRTRTSLTGYPSLPEARTLVVAPSPEAAPLAAFESARRLVARDAMELQSGIAVASDETLDCVLEALRSAEGLHEHALAPAAPAAAAPSPRASFPEPRPERGTHATTMIEAVAMPPRSPSVPPSARHARLLRTLRLPPALAASSPSPSPHRTPSSAPRRGPSRSGSRSRGRRATFGVLAALGMVAGAALAWLVIGTPQVLARSAPPASERTAAAR
ncbi:MAG: hypothetical protein WKG00_38515 [Polyangiaceae bacterium]